MNPSLPGVLFGVVGALATALNFYLSWVRYPIHRWTHGDKRFKFVSGAPLIGSLFLWFAAAVFFLGGQSPWAWACLFLSLFDTGGLHWFAIQMIYQSRKKR
jgi:hypothetical protein